MEALREVTEWPSKTQGNHTYLLEGSKLVAYMREGTTEPIYLKHPMSFDKKHRSFVKADAKAFKTLQNTSVEVRGSKGETYSVDAVKRVCTCPGFRFKGTCKHLAQVLKG